jgi:hypothetical protein
MSEIRDYNEVYAEQVAIAAAAGQAAMSAAADQQTQTGVWIDVGLSGDLREGPADPPAA